jgi:hypothetical protein
MYLKKSKSPNLKIYSCPLKLGLVLNFLFFWENLGFWIQAFGILSFRDFVFRDFINAIFYPLKDPQQIVGFFENSCNVKKIKKIIIIIY